MEQSLTSPSFFELNPTNTSISGQSPSYTGMVAPSAHPTSITFIDSRVSNPWDLADRFQADLSVLLDPGIDGISQISEILSQHQGVSSINIISHGSTGSLQLGDESISTANLQGYSSLLMSWQSHLTDDADIMIYGCNVALGETGRDFVNKLSTLTGADVAASDNITGSPIRGGDWTLEFTTGPIEQANLVSASLLNSYDGTLQTLFTSQTPSQPNFSDGYGVDWEFGMRFSSRQTGFINDIRFYKSPSETGVHLGKIWSSTGSILASVVFTNESASGWQQQALQTPLRIEAGATYTVSVNTNGYYVTTLQGFDASITNGDLIAPVGAGVYNEKMGSFPNQVYLNENYFRDVDFTPLSASSSTAPIPVPIGTGTGLLGEYFDNIDFTNSKLTRADSTINFNWQSGSPASAVGADTFSVCWTGQVQPRYSETYTFYTTADDGIRLWVDGKQIINNFVDQAPTEQSGAITLEAGKKYDIRVEYYEKGGGAVAQLAWSSPSQAKQIIPQSQLFGAAEALVSTPTATVGQGQNITPPATTDPTWSAGRDSNGQLIVNSGTWGNITFQSEYRGSYPIETDFRGPTPVDRVAYDWNLDGYNGQPLGSYRSGGGAYANADLAHPAWKDGAFRNVLIKNWNIKNAYKTMPGPHVDVTQIYDSVGWGGFFVAQDSTFKNSDDGIVQWQFGYNGNTLPAYEGKQQSDFGGVVVQGVTLNQEADFIADAAARVSLNGESTVVQGNYLGSWDPGVGWFINYQTNGWPITLQQRWEKVIVIGSLPDFRFRTGDAYAFSVATTPTAGQPSAFGGRVFYYPTIEAALAAGHEEPPFVRLSTSGWANPEANAPGARDWLPPAGW